jgi:phage terminase large subunit-like protein
MKNCKQESPLSWLASLPLESQQSFLKRLNNQQLKRLPYQWRGWKARPNQLAPEGSWRVWLIMAGRGFGKTRSGAEWVREQAESGRARRIALVAENAAEARQVMIEGESGILAISPPHSRPIYEPSKRQLRWANGAVATTYSGDEPDQLRGPQHDAAWADEPAKWKYPNEAWDNLELGLRLGSNPQIVATTTPRPIPLLRQLLRDPMTVVTRGSTFDNIANLPAAFIQRVRTKYEGTRLGRQELYAELLEDVPGALWTRECIEANRLVAAPCDMRRIVVAIDPAATSGEGANETGIIIAGEGIDGNGYVLKDLSGRMPPDAWAQIAVRGYHHYKADRIVGESNNGGEMIERVLRTVDANIPYRAVHASRGKIARAEPVSALYAQGRMKHVGVFLELEEQMCSYVPGKYDGSPDRMDALVWAISEFLDPEVVTTRVYYEDRVRISPY